jgi:hypothetical protein
MIQSIGDFPSCSSVDLFRLLKHFWQKAIIVIWRQLTVPRIQPARVALIATFLHCNGFHNGPTIEHAAKMLSSFETYSTICETCRFEMFSIETRHRTSSTRERQGVMRLIRQAKVQRGEV